MTTGGCEAVQNSPFAEALGIPSRCSGSPLVLCWERRSSTPPWQGSRRRHAVVAVLFGPTSSWCSCSSITWITASGVWRSDLVLSMLAVACLLRLRASAAPSAFAAGAETLGLEPCRPPVESAPSRARSQPEELAAERLLARGELPLRRADLPARQPAAARAAAARAHQAAAARPLRHDAGPEPDLRAPEPRDPRARPERDLHHRPGTRRAGPRRQHLPRGHLQRGLPAGDAGRGRAARALPAVLLPRRDPEPRRSRDAGLDPRGRRARLRARARVRRRVRQSRPARRLRRRRRRGRDGPARGELAREQVPEPADRRRGAADPPSQRLQDREPDRPRADPRARSWSSLLEGYGYRPILVGGSTQPRAPCTRRFAGALDAALDEIAAIQAQRATTACRRAAAVADDRAAHAEGLDGPEGGRRPARRGFVAVASGSDDRRARATPSTCACSKSGCAATSRRSSSTSTGRSVPELAELPPKGERRMSANPNANGGVLLRELVLPDFRDYAVEVPEPGTTTSEATSVLGAFLRDVIARNADNFRLFGPDETASNRLGDVFDVTDRGWLAETKPDRRGPRARRPRDGGPLRAPLPGLARGLPADGPARPLQLLRGVHPHHRLDVQPACEVAEGDARRSRGGAPSPRSTTSSARTSGARITTASRTRIPASSTTS